MPDFQTGTPNVQQPQLPISPASLIGADGKGKTNYPTSVALIHPANPNDISGFGASQWGITVNGISASDCDFDISNIQGGMRFDQQPALGYHFPQLVAQGYELCQFDFELSAYDQMGLNQCQSVMESVFPTVADTSSSRQKLKVSSIVHTPINTRGMNFFVVQFAMPFLGRDKNEPDRIFWKAKFILFSPPKQMGLGNIGQANQGYNVFTADKANPGGYSNSAGAPGSVAQLSSVLP
jgi:hypothetical protein